MAKVTPFHSKKTLDVHHTCSKCMVGDNIQPENKVSGTGGLPKCKTCADLERNGKC